MCMNILLQDLFIVRIQTNPSQFHSFDLFIILKHMPTKFQISYGKRDDNRDV